jgi:hypothetical protein
LVSERARNQRVVVSRELFNPIFPRSSRGSFLGLAAVLWLVGVRGSLTPTLSLPKSPVRGYSSWRAAAARKSKGGGMGSFAKLARRAVETEAPVMVKVMDGVLLPCQNRVFDSRFLGLVFF